MRSLLLAIGFLTVFPVQVEDLKPGDLGRAALWFPLVGLAMGAVLAAANHALSLIFQPPVGAALTVALWAAVTGGLHLDGLADCCDGMFASATPERRLELMRDPRLGSFGATGLALFLILKVLALAAASQTGLVLLFAPALARWLILLVGLHPAARPGGLGADFALGLRPYVFLIAAIVPFGMLFVASFRTVPAAGMAHLVALGIVALARARLGGVTGDVFGLTVEVGELTTLLTFAVSL